MSIISVPYWGSLYFNNVRRIKLGDTRVSVPYWGSLYFNMFNSKMYKKYYPFPSPIGVLYISIVMAQIYTYIVCQFPSPIGVLYISIKRVQSLKCRLKKVSVPYWGSLYFN